MVTIKHAAKDICTLLVLQDAIVRSAETVINTFVSLNTKEALEYATFGVVDVAAYVDLNQAVCLKMYI